MRVVCVVVTHNGSPWVEQCLTSVTANDHQTHVIVVDNASTDHTLEIVSSVPNVEIVRLDENKGFGAANNIGIRRGLQVGADYILLLNQDAWLLPDTIDILAKQMQKNPAIGIASPLHWDASGKHLDNKFCGYICDHAPVFVSDLLHDSLKPTYVVPFVNAAIWLITRQCIEQVGGFDPLYFMYGEDSDYCRRVDFHGLHIAIVPSAHAHHARGTIQQTKTVWQKLLHRSEITKSELVYDLMEPVHSLVYLLLRQAFRSFRTTLTLLSRGATSEILAQWLAFVKAIFLLQHIQQHRILSMTGTRQWI
jgi:GT2 family glycosyltransferase